MQGAGDAAGDAVQLDADEALPGRGMAHELAGAAAGLEDGGVLGHAEAGQGGCMAVMTTGEVKNWLNTVRRARIVFRRGQQGFELVAEGLPAGILVAAGHRVGEDRQGHRPEAAEAGKYAPFIGSGGTLLPLDGLQRPDGGDDVAGFGFLAAGDAGRWGGRVGSFHGGVSSCRFRPRQPGPFAGATDRRLSRARLPRRHRAARCRPQRRRARQVAALAGRRFAT